MDIGQAGRWVLEEFGRNLRGKLWLTRPFLSAQLYRLPGRFPDGERTLTRVLAQLVDLGRLSHFRTDDGGAVYTLTGNSERWSDVENQIRRTHAFNTRAFYGPVRFPEGVRPVRAAFIDAPRFVLRTGARIRGATLHEARWTCVGPARRS